MSTIGGFTVVSVPIQAYNPRAYLRHTPDQLFDRSYSPLDV